MKEILLFLCAICVLCGECLSQNFVTYKGDNIQDLQGNKLAAGQICLQSANNSGVPISYQAGGGGQTISTPKCAVVSNGAFSMTVANSALTNPQNVCFKATVRDTSTGQIVLGSGSAGSKTGYECLQTAISNSWCTAGVCNFDVFVPNLAPLPVSNPGTAIPGLTSDEANGINVAGTVHSPQFCIAADCITGWPSGGGSGVPITGVTAGQFLTGFGGSSFSKAAPDWNYLLNRPSTFTPSIHSHTESDITNLSADLAAKLNASSFTLAGVVSLWSSCGSNYLKGDGTCGAGSGSADWNSITGKPATFAPSAHSHPESDITNLSTDLAAKLNASSFTVAGVVSLWSSCGSNYLKGDGTCGPASGGTWGSITGTLSAQADLNTALAGKAAIAHSHAESDVTNLVSDLAAKATDASVVHKTGTESISGTKTFAVVQTNVEYSLGTCTTAATINPANGNRQSVTLTAGQTCALTFVQPSAGTVSITLKVTQSSSGSVDGKISGGRWPGNAGVSGAPVITGAAGAVDFVTCYLDGANAWCQIAQNF